MDSYTEYVFTLKLHWINLNKMKKKYLNKNI